MNHSYLKKSLQMSKLTWINQQFSPARQLGCISQVKVDNIIEK